MVTSAASLVAVLAARVREASNTVMAEWESRSSGVNTSACRLVMHDVARFTCLGGGDGDGELVLGSRLSGPNTRIVTTTGMLNPSQH